MSTGYLYNAYGKYETAESGELGITLSFAGVGFWLPFEKVTPIPNYNFREVDHDKSTPSGGQVGALVYMNVRVPGDKIVDTLANGQIPYSNSFRGIQTVTGKRTGKMLPICEGRDAETGAALMTEVPEVVQTSDEAFEAEKAALEYKQRIVADYFQSKRERMLGSPGKSHPDKLTRTFMDELGVEDIDDVSAHAKKAGIDPEALRVLIQELSGAKA